MADNRIKLALQFASKGWCLFPQDRNKKPCIKEMLNQASSDSEQIRKWAKQFPKANFAVATGEKSGILVLDVDVKSGQHGKPSLVLLQREHGKLETFTVRTGSGGGHLYFKYPTGNGRIPCRALQGYSGIEIKADGGSTTLAGSLYADGREYVLTKDTDLAPCPKWLLDSVKSPIKSLIVSSNDKNISEKIEKGERNNRLASLAGSMRNRGMEEDSILSALLIENDQKCNPPLSSSEVKTIAESVARYKPNKEKKSESQATQLVELAQDVEFFHADDEAYTTIIVNGHQENWTIKNKSFRRWLIHRFYLKTGKTPSTQALQDALGVLEGKALFASPEKSIYTRIAGDDTKIYLDLGNPKWEIIEVTATGWKILSNPPVKFRRPKGIKCLPYPKQDGSIDDLRGYVNINNSDDWKMLIAWLIQAFRPRGPYPILVLHGEQGSAKSSTAKVLRELVDPNIAILRSAPREERDLVIAATNGWCVAFDNLSKLPGWLSDALCRLSSGAGSSTRLLYSDAEEMLFQVQRPIILNGIEELAIRGDILDRSLILYLPQIADKYRKPETEFNKCFAHEQPGIFGAILDIVSKTMGNLNRVKVPELPRMADFAQWIIAAQPALDWPMGSFLKSYGKNRSQANELTLEASPVYPEIRSLIEKDKWSGTVTELLNELNLRTPEKITKQKYWPKSPRSLSNALRRLVSNMRAVGISIEFRHDGKKRIVEIMSL